MNAILCTIDSDFHVLSAAPPFLESLPVHFLQVPGSAKSARSESLATQLIYGELNTPAPVSGSLAALVGQFSSTALIRIKLYSSAGRIGLIHDSNNQPVAPKGGKWFHVFSGTGFYRSYEISIIDPNNPRGYHQFARLIVGKFFQPKINIQPNFSYLRNTTATQTRMSDGSLKATAGGEYSDFSFSCAHLKNDERAALDVFVDQVGLARDFFMALQPSNTHKYDFVSVVMFSAIPPIQFRYFQAYGADFRVSEALGGQAAMPAINPPPPPEPIPPGAGGEGTENGYWIARLNGKEGVSSRYQAASNGSGVVVALRGQDTLQRSTDFGLTYTEISVPGLLATDIQWTGQYFCGCDALGFIYYSQDGLHWTSVGDGTGHRLDAISGVGGYLLAAGARVYGFDINDQVFEDHTALTGWAETSACAVLYSAESDYIFALSGNTKRIYRYTVANGAMLSFIPSGLPADSTYELALVFNNLIAAKMSDGNVYRSINGGASFSLWLSPPTEYDIHDLILTRRPELLAIMERKDLDARWRRVFDSLGSEFVELSVRISYAGRQMLISENARAIAYSIVDEPGGEINIGIDTDMALVQAFDESGAPVHIDWKINGGIISWAANPAFSGKITAFVNNTVLQG